jgi:hypothetical protein
MPHAHTEGQRVGQPAIGLFAELGWETKGEVVLVPRLRAALEPLNPTLPPEAMAQLKRLAAMFGDAPALPADVLTNAAAALDWAGMAAGLQAVQFQRPISTPSALRA